MTAMTPTVAMTTAQIPSSGENHEMQLKALGVNKVHYTYNMTLQ